MRIKFLKPHGKQVYTINYLFQKEQNNEECKLILTTGDNNSKESWINTTSEYCQNRKEQTGFNIDWNKNTMHLVVSVHPEDAKKMENNWMSVLEDIHKELGIGNNENNSIAWLHQDKDHHHIHLLFSKVNYAGERWEDSNIGRKLNALAIQYDAAYELTPGSADPDVKNEKKPLISKINNVLKFAYDNSNNFNDFINICKENGIEVVIIEKGNDNLIEYIDMETGKKASQSAFSRRYSFEALKNLDKSNPEKRFVAYQEQILYVKNSVSKALNNAQSINEFKKILSDKYSIDLIQHSNSSGVFGYSFKQNSIANPISVKASQVNLSYKKIHYYLNKKQESSIVKTQSTPTKEFENVNEFIPKSPVYGLSQTEEDDQQLQKKKKRKRDRNI